MNDYRINGVEGSWEDLVKIAKEKHLRNIEKTPLHSLIATLKMKGVQIVRIPQDSPELS